MPGAHLLHSASSLLPLYSLLPPLSSLFILSSLFTLSSLFPLSSLFTLSSLFPLSCLLSPHFSFLFLFSFSALSTAAAVTNSNKRLPLRPHGAKQPDLHFPDPLNTQLSADHEHGGAQLSARKRQVFLREGFGSSRAIQMATREVKTPSEYDARLIMLNCCVSAHTTLISSHNTSARPLLSGNTHGCWLTTNYCCLTTNSTND